MTDEHIPAEKRQAIVEDLLGGKTTTTTIQLVSMVVGSGRSRDIPAIVISGVRWIEKTGGKSDYQANS